MPLSSACRSRRNLSQAHRRNAESTAAGQVILFGIFGVSDAACATHFFWQYAALHMPCQRRTVNGTRSTENCRAQRSDNYGQHRVVDKFRMSVHANRSPGNLAETELFPGFDCPSFAVIETGAHQVEILQVALRRPASPDGGTDHDHTHFSSVGNSMHTARHFFHDVNNRKYARHGPSTRTTSLQGSSIRIRVTRDCILDNKLTGTPVTKIARPGSIGIARLRSLFAPPSPNCSFSGGASKLAGWEGFWEQKVPCWGCRPFLLGGWLGLQACAASGEAHGRIQSSPQYCRRAVSLPSRSLRNLLRCDQYSCHV